MTPTSSSFEVINGTATSHWSSDPHRASTRMEFLLEIREAGLGTTERIDSLLNLIESDGIIGLSTGAFL